MKAMLLAAGLGTRMRPLTHTTPKPLLRVHGKPLICHHLERLSTHGVSEVVINTGHLGAAIERELGSDAGLGLNIRYSHEPADAPLETGAGIRKALPLLGEQPFLVISADTYAEFDYPVQLEHGCLGVLLMVQTAEHPSDFYLDAQGLLHVQAQAHRRALTYAGCALLHPRLVTLVQGERYPLADCFRAALRQGGRLVGRLHQGEWHDVGTAQKLEQLNRTGSE